MRQQPQPSLKRYRGNSPKQSTSPSPSSRPTPHSVSPPVRGNSSVSKPVASAPPPGLASAPLTTTTSTPPLPTSPVATQQVTLQKQHIKVLGTGIPYLEHGGKSYKIEGLTNLGNYAPTTQLVIELTADPEKYGYGRAIFRSGAAMSPADKEQAERDQAAAKQVAQAELISKAKVLMQDTSNRLEFATSCFKHGRDGRETSGYVSDMSDREIKHLIEDCCNEEPESVSYERGEFKVTVRLPTTRARETILYSIKRLGGKTVVKAFHVGPGG